MTQDVHHQALVDAIAERVTAAVLRELRAAGALPAAEPSPRLAQVDRDALAGLLPAVWAACGVRVMAVADLMDRARLHPALAAAIERATGRPHDQAQVALGRLFRRALGCSVDGLQVHRVGLSRGVALWQMGFTPTANDGFGGMEPLTNPSSDNTKRGRSPTTSA